MKAYFKWTYLALITSIGLIQSCGNNKINSNTQTTSDRVREYIYEVDGEIAIPTNREIVKLGYLFDLAREKVEYPDDQTRQEKISAIVTDPNQFDEAFFGLFSEKNIVSATGEVNKNQLDYWLARQLKYSKNQLLKNGIEISYRDLISYKIVKKEQHATLGEIIKISYKARILGVSTGALSSGVVQFEPIQNGTVLNLPLNEVTAYFEQLEGTYLEVLNTAPQNVGEHANEILNKILQSKLIEQSKSQTFPCLQKNDSGLSPFNFFYYIDFALPNCQNKLVQSNTTISKSEINPIKVTYPEYHRLFEDKVVDIFLFYGKVDSEDRVARQDMETRIRNGYVRLNPNDPSENLWRISKKIGDIEFRITYGIEKLMPTAREEFQNSISNHEIVVYDGHAGYGYNISSNFNNPESYAKDKYQIIFLHGCSTYKYGVTEILSAKAIRDFDFLNQNVDIVATFENISGHKPQNEFLNDIEKVAAIYSRYGSNIDGYKDFEKNYSWLSLVTKVNKISETIDRNKNGGFLVTGEEQNDWRPGKAAFVNNIEIDSNSLKNIIENDSNELTLRQKALSAWLAELTKFVDSYESLLSQSKDYCLTLKKDVRESNFYTEHCQLKSVNIKSDHLKYGNYQWIHGQTVEFYSNGQAKNAKTTQPISISLPSQIIQVKDEIKFHENGKISEGILVSDATLYSNIQFKKDFPIQIDHDFSIISGHIAPVNYQGIKIGGQTIFHSNNSVKRSQILETYFDPRLKQQFLPGEIAFNAKGQIIEGLGTYKIDPQFQATGQLHFSIDSTSIQAIRLEQDMKWKHNIIFAAESLLTFENGFIAKGYNKEEFTYRNFLFEVFEFMPIEFYPNGNIKLGLVKNQTTCIAPTLTCLDGPISFYPSGSIRSVRVSGIYNSITLMEDAPPVELYESGELMSGMFLNEQNNRQFMKFSKTGKRLDEILTENRIIDQYLIPAGSFIYYQEDGKIERIEAKPGLKSLISNIEVKHFKSDLYFNDFGKVVHLSNFAADAENNIQFNGTPATVLEFNTSTNTPTKIITRKDLPLGTNKILPCGVTQLAPNLFNGRYYFSNENQLIGCTLKQNFREYLSGETVGMTPSGEYMKLDRDNWTNFEKVWGIYNLINFY